MEIGDFYMDPENAVRRDAFLALLGSDKVRPVAYMLRDHLNGVGRKEARRIMVVPCRELVELNLVSFNG